KFCARFPHLHRFELQQPIRWAQGKKKKKNVLSGGKGNDKLYGSEGADLLDGGEGNDLLKGGYGNDIYRYLSGYGHHIIDDDGGKDDKLSLADI
ncbi:calcium-binding protein, partial [Escherichia coli]|uniref:calcium-binding protein n=1 Tax=Escherichia coli TaxID=562 RepID=UPI002032345D